MSLRYKLLLLFLPPLLIAELGLGIWVYWQELRSAYQHEMEYLALLAKQHSDTIARYQQLLISNNLADVPVYRESYQRRIIAEMTALNQSVGRELAVFVDGELVTQSSTIEEEHRVPIAAWDRLIAASEVAGPALRSVASEQGELSTGTLSWLYAKAEYRHGDWHWVVVSLRARQEVLASANSIRFITMMMALGLAALAILLSFPLFESMILRPLKILRSSAVKIAEGQEVSSVPLYSNDEFEEVARCMEAMARTIQQRFGELKALTQALEESNQSLDDFVYIASHDLKEPLRGMRNHASFMLADYRRVLDEAGCNRLQRMMDLAEQQGQMLDALRQYSRVGRERIHYSEVDVATLVKSVTDGLKELLEERGVELQVVTPLPPLLCHPAWAATIFHNLIVNATKYNDHPNPKVEIGFIPSQEAQQRFGTRVQGACLSEGVYYVRDNGIGIDPKQHEAIFTIFKRLHPKTAYGGGSGAGLAIVKKMIERQGGAIWVDSQPAAGATFYFTLELSESVDLRPKDRLLQAVLFESGKSAGKLT